MKNFALLCCLVIASLSTKSLAEEHLKNLDIKLSPQQMKEDVKAWRNWLDKTHPELAIRVKNADHFDTQINEMTKAFVHPQTVRGFLADVSLLNSQFNDGHMNIFLQSQAKLINAIIDKGKGLFPFEVIVDSGRVYISSMLGGDVSQLSMAEIDTINNKPISEIYNTLISRVYGDTAKHRDSILSEKFALYYWLFIEQGEQFSIGFKNSSVPATVTTQVFNAAKTKPKALLNESFEDLFNFELLDKKQALLTIDLFWWQDKTRFYQFTKHVFQQLKDKGIEHLIIDIRNNPGGDDDMWKKGVLSYIADKPYRHTSKYTKKIIAKYMDEGETLGDVVTAEYNKLELPNDKEPLKFDGKVSVIVGKVTYSSAILFANTMQDYGFAQIVGQQSAGYSWQTGGIQFFTLPHSGLKAVSPRFYLVRPSGKGRGLPVIPDIELTEDPLNPRTLIDKIAKAYLDSSSH